MHFTALQFVLNPDIGGLVSESFHKDGVVQIILEVEDEQRPVRLVRLTLDNKIGNIYLDYGIRRPKQLDIVEFHNSHLGRSLFCLPEVSFNDSFVHHVNLVSIFFYLRAVSLANFNAKIILVISQKYI